MKMKLTPKFILSLIALGGVLAVCISFFGYYSSKNYLEAMYAQRVITGSKAIAQLLSPEQVREVLAEGGEESEAYRELSQKLNTLKEDGDVTYLSLVVPDEDSVTFYIDACVESMGDDPANQLAYGSDIPYTEAASGEDDLKNYYTVWEYYSRNEGVPTPLITDNSYGFNYTAVYPILDESGTAIAEVQYILDMQGVRTHLQSFLWTMLMLSAAVILVAMVCYVLFVRKTILKPVGQLAAFAKGITSDGKLQEEHIAMHTGDEIEELADSFNYMLVELNDYIDNLASVTAEKERIGAELDLARNIQGSVLPCVFPAFPDRREFDIHATMTPAKEVAGDFYDFFLLDHDHLALVMADVSGKGVPAALFMMISKTLLKTAAQNDASPKAVLETVNNQLCENNQAKMFVTVWFGILQISTGKLRCANAGHEYPAIRRANGAYELFKDKHGFVLAGMENMRYKEYELTLEPGDSIFVYTDGVTEATAAGNQLYGTDRMIAALNKQPFQTCQTLLKTVHDDIDAFVGEAPQFDDITMLCLRMTPKNRLTLNPTQKSIPRVAAFVEETLTEAGIPTKTVQKANIALDEIYSNIVYYSQATVAEVWCEADGETVALSFTDNGIPYDPLKKEDPDVSMPGKERKIGGLGIFMVKKIMDEVTYRYEDGKNILTLKKRID